jgi:antitoxin PrlF
MQAFLRGEGWVSIPMPLRERLGLRPGDVIDFDLETGGRIVLRKIQSAHPELEQASEGEPDRFDLATGSAGPGPSTEEMMKLLRGDPDE